MSRATRTVAAPRPLKPPPGKHVMPALEGVRSAREDALLNGLDPDRVNAFAECLFTLNNRRFGPIPGAYVVVCTAAGRRWCVGQLCADRARPVRLLEALEFDSEEKARRAALRLRRERGEVPPSRSL